MIAPSDDAGRDVVSRRRYERERRAREEAEALLEAKSRELFAANENLERLVAERTAKLTEALATAEEASAMRARFLAVMSHEIRTPLGGLMGMLDLLREEDMSSTASDLIEAALHSGESLKRIVDDVLDLSALDAGRMRFESEPVDLRALARGVCALLEPRAAAKGLSLRISIAEDVPARFLGDATRLRQVLSNLCDNAVKFSDRGDVAVDAETRSGDDGAVLRVTVRDNGPGISEADQARLFADFGQLDAGLTKRTEGTGLGLSICRRIVEGLGGRIGVHSRAGAGAAFWFELPLLPAPDAAPLKPRADRQELAAETRLRGQRILVAEDNPINRRLVGAYLTHLGAEHAFAPNGREALRMAERDRYDLILMDIAMPEMDGISAAMAIRAGRGVSRHTPIIGFTAHVVPSVRRDCAAAGMAEVITKPITFDAFADALARHVEQPADHDAAPAVGPDSGGSHAIRAEVRSPRADMAPDADLLLAFQRDADMRITLMRRALAHGDRDAIAREAHAVRGAAGLLGAKDANEIAAAIEEGAHDLDRADIDEALQDLGEAIRAYGS